MKIVFYITIYQFLILYIYVNLFKIKYQPLPFFSFDYFSRVNPIKCAKRLTRFDECLMQNSNVQTIAAADSFVSVFHVCSYMSYVREALFPFRLLLLLLFNKQRVFRQQQQQHDIRAQLRDVNKLIMCVCDQVDEIQV